ncbi:50S ribosomal protein L4 [Candidatus Peregrinibacteria bacterium]|jgi:large subunit ribosomal protein L4|nr:50S ribosomal protein L4 [Candidatus Peregrinibacteria bacterium]MBT3599070.1 50S ribosomal protein L4 [Candidatus Peregrinibacteria bacterium]MBT4367695.1 50S ribosomal protein L4 [Candidatus Peregrinibacteria bacterium]MBT4585619.1 50S ribosomal protein L4 [Candidatus Peregrinibacteria bacterium]MBT6730376.1 50S ribosomal protein L4 [Candidatus Peregrinibacteria bacterium]
MKIDVYSATGVKKGAAELPASIFEAAINEGLMHQAVVRQQSNRRYPIAHVKSRGEVKGSTRKLFAQKGTGRARRGSARSPILRGGGKAFGPRNNANFVKNMPKKMRRAALKSCLSMQASNGVIIGLEGYPNEVKTKGVIALLEKLPVSVGRTILFVLPERHEDLQLSIRNVPGAKTVNVAYLNPVDVLCADSIIFMVDSIKMTEEIFGGKEVKKKAPAKKTDTKAAPKKEEEKKEVKKPVAAKAPKAEEKKEVKKVPAKKAAPKKKTTTPKAK